MLSNQATKRTKPLQPLHHKSTKPHQQLHHKSRPSQRPRRSLQTTPHTHHAHHFLKPRSSHHLPHLFRPRPHMNQSKAPHSQLDSLTEVYHYAPPLSSQRSSFSSSTTSTISTTSTTSSISQRSGLFFSNPHRLANPNDDNYNNTSHNNHNSQRYFTQSTNSTSPQTPPNQKLQSLQVSDNEITDDELFSNNTGMAQNKPKKKFRRLTQQSFAHRPRVITLDITGTLLQPTQPIADLYTQSAAKVGIIVHDQVLLADCFKRAYIQCNDLYPCFGHGQLPSSRHWWYQVVSRTFSGAGYNLPYQQQDALFDQIYTDFGLAEVYHVFNDVLPFLHFIERYNKYVSDPVNQKELYKYQRKMLQSCLISSSSENEEERCLDTHAYLHYNPILIGIISNGDSRYQDSILPLLTISKYINFFVISEREGSQKPHYSLFDCARTKANQLASYLGWHDNNHTVINYQQPNNQTTTTTTTTTKSNKIDNTATPTTPTTIRSSSSQQSDSGPCLTQTLHSGMSQDSAIEYEDFLHIGDSLNEDIIGAIGANFDQVYLLRDSEHERKMGDYLKQLELYQNNHDDDQQDQGFVHEMTDLSSIIQDHNTMRAIANHRLAVLQEKGIGADLDIANVSTFRNLLQVRDAYFHDIVPKLV